ncbi:MAG: Fe-only nitrogenase accessory AnfO family protein [Intestinibacillus sp.]
MQITVLMDPLNRVTVFEQGGTLKLYEKHAENWVCQRLMAYSTEGLALPEDMRERLQAVRIWMDGCKTLAAARFRGTYRAVLEPQGIDMWEMSGFSGMDAVEFLTFYEHQDNAAPAESMPDVPLTPQEQEPGCNCGTKYRSGAKTC